MSDLISRQDAKDAIDMALDHIDHVPTWVYDNLLNALNEVSSAEPERKTAEWIYGENGGQDGWYCSKCGLFIPWDYEYYGLDNIDFIEDFKTCPFCDSKMVSYTGADTKEGEEDEIN